MELFMFGGIREDHEWSTRYLDRLSNRSPGLSRNIALNYTGWKNDRERERFFRTLSISSGRLGSSGWSVFVTACGSCVPATRFDDPQSGKRQRPLTRLKITSQNIMPGLVPQMGYPIRNKFQKKLVGFYPKSHIDHLVSILRNEWGEDLPFRDGFQGGYRLIEFLTGEERIERNRERFFQAFEKAGLPVQEMAVLIKISDHWLSKVISGEGEPDDLLVEAVERLNEKMADFAEVLCDLVEDAARRSGNRVKLFLKKRHPGNFWYNIPPEYELFINSRPVNLSGKSYGTSLLCKSHFEKIMLMAGVSEKCDALF